MRVDSDFRESPPNAHTIGVDLDTWRFKLWAGINVADAFWIYFCGSKSRAQTDQT